jgi:cyclophilin family peptidyl-prolyl cis-trans isomerase
MRLFFLVLIMLATLGMASAQSSYSPKQGETVIRVAVEGRGNIYIQLFTKEAPQTTGHILDLVRSGFYNSQRFHRVVKSPRPYLVQIGDPASKTQDVSDGASGGSGVRIPYENTGMGHVQGAVGLAAQPDDKNSGDSQFYIMLAPAKFLDGNYTVFGRVVLGMDVVQKIERGDRVVSISLVK